MWLLLLLACPLPKTDTGDSGRFDSCSCPSPDADGDGWERTEDCDEYDPAVNPGATEACNGNDDDCDGERDEGVTTTFYADADGDGFGDPATATETCDSPSGSTDGTDCDDADASVNPGATELCDERDQDCDGTVDDGAAPLDGYLDADGDGHGDPASAASACPLPAGYVLAGDDCDDGDPAVSPDALEDCNGRDDDCDGAADETVYVAWDDADGDGYGAGTPFCLEGDTGGASVADNGTDCDDADPTENPAAVEACDGDDDDCDGAVDEGC